MISDTVRKQIHKQLQSLESKHNIRIVYACESGSRAWGFPSHDSDYDVRFIYVHDRDWYLKLAHQRDVIDLPIVDELDLGGWELQKSLRLLRESNCALVEWLDSPIVYESNRDFIDLMKRLVSASFNPKVGHHHYLSLGARKLDSLLNATNVRIKDYFYALRALLAGLYITEHAKEPPMELAPLLENVQPVSSIRRWIDTTIESKNDGTESDQLALPSEQLNFLIDSKNQLEKSDPTPSKRADWQAFDECFLKILENR